MYVTVGADFISARFRIFYFCDMISQTGRFAPQILTIKGKIKMDKETLFDRFDTGLKVRLSGNILTLICILLRIFVFPNSVSPLLTLIPLVIGYIMALFISAVVTNDDGEEIPADKYADYFDEFEAQHKKLGRFLSTSTLIYFVVSVFLTVTRS